MLEPKKGLLLVVPVKTNKTSKLIPEHLHPKNEENRYDVYRHNDEFVLVEKTMVEEVRVFGEKFWVVEEKYVVGTLDKKRMLELIGE